MTLPDFPEPAASQAAAPPRASLKFAPLLVPKLRSAHAALNARLAELLVAIDRDPGGNAKALEECSRQFLGVREAETTWIFPTLATALEGDADARGQLAELRLVGLILARRVLRCFDDLQQAVRAEALVADAAHRLAATLARYLSHSDSAIYPLYELIGSAARPRAATAA
jgi:hypothetical protein